jgi:hypothetical protein
MSNSDRPDEWDDQAFQSEWRDRVVNLKPKELKCATCHIRVPYNEMAIGVALTTCKNIDKKGEDSCHLKQLHQHLARMQEKSEGKPKQLPRLLENKEFVPMPMSQRLDLLAKGVPQWRIREIEEGMQVVGPMQPVLHARDVVDAEIISVTVDTTEITVPDPIRVHINKKGFLIEETVD